MTGWKMVEREPGHQRERGDRPGGVAPNCLTRTTWAGSYSTSAMATPINSHDA